MNPILSIFTGLVLIGLIAISIYLIVITNSLKTDLDKNKTNTTLQNDQLSSLKSSFTSMNNQLQKINSVFSSDMKSLNGIETLNMTNGWGLTSSFPNQLQFFGTGLTTKKPQVYGFFKYDPSGLPTGQMYLGSIDKLGNISTDKCSPGTFC